MRRVTTYVSLTTGGRIVRLMLVGMTLFLVLIGYVFYQSYEGRVNIVNAQRTACERGKKDHTNSALGWRALQDQANSQGQPWFSVTYSKVAGYFEIRSQISCAKAFPKAGFLP